MTDERRPDFERELAAALERTAPEPRPDALSRVVDEVAAVRQRPRWRAALAGGEPSGWRRGLAFGAVGAAALVVGMAIGASGLLPTGDLPSPTPDASASPPDASRSPAPAPDGWTEVVLDSGTSTGSDVSIVGGLAWDEGAVLTGHLFPAAAEGQVAAAWHSGDGASWMRASFVGDGVPFPRSIGPVVDAGDRLLAFGTGQDANGADVTLLYASTDSGATWEIVDAELPGSAVIADVVRFNNQLVAIGASMDEPSAPVIWTSADGVRWEHTELAGDNGLLIGRFTAIASDSTQLVMLGAVTDRLGEEPRPTVMTTTTPSSLWNIGEVPASPDAELRDLVYFGQVWHAVGSDGGRPASWWSADGYGWRSVPLAADGTGSLRAIGVGSEGLVAVGDVDGRAMAWRSISGQRWEVGEVLIDQGVLSVVLTTPSGVVVAGTVVDTDGASQPMAWLRASAAPVTWQEPDAYSFVMDASCGERQLLGRFRVTVRDGQTVGVEWVGEGNEPPGITPDVVPTLADLVDRANEARTRPEAHVELTLHPVLGYPTAVSIDWDTQAIDDEECYVINEYVPDG